MKLLSFIIPSYNSARFLPKCIPSLLHPEVVEEVEVIIVNDGSTDETPQVAQSFCDACPGSVRLINQENKGHGGALNTGCAAATGKFLKVIDADDWIVTENLPAFLAFLRTCESDVVLTHHHTVNISTAEVLSWKSYPEAFGVPYNFTQIMSQWKSFDRSLTFHGITYNTAFYHKNAMLLSEHVFYEDHEFATVPCCYATSVTPVDLFLYEYRIGDLEQSVSDANQLKRLSHTEAVLNRLMAEYPLLRLPEEDDRRRYFAMKAQGLLLSYFTTAMLVDPDKKQGRRRGEAMLNAFREKLPLTYELAKKQYRIFRILNRLGISKAAFEKLQHSRLYNRLRHNHDFN